MTKIFITLKNFFTFKRIFNTLLILWVIFSAGYIAYDLWLKFRIRLFQAGYQQALNDSVKAMIQQAEKCQTISVVDGDKKVDLISVGCLKPQNKMEEKQPKTGE